MGVDLHFFEKFCVIYFMFYFFHLFCLIKSRLRKRSTKNLHQCLFMYRVSYLPQYCQLSLWSVPTSGKACWCRYAFLLAHVYEICSMRGYFLIYNNSVTVFLQITLCMYFSGSTKWHAGLFGCTCPLHSEFSVCCLPCIYLEIGLGVMFLCLLVYPDSEFLQAIIWKQKCVIIHHKI